MFLLALFFFQGHFKDYILLEWIPLCSVVDRDTSTAEVEIQRGTAWKHALQPLKVQNTVSFQQGHLTLVRAN